MELIRGVHNIRTRHFGCVMTIGNFDGVHKGHRAVLAGLKADAERLGLPSTVLLFEPQPQEFFAKSKAPARLTPLRDKLQLLSECGIERVVCINFNQRFAGMSAESFIEQVIVTKLGVRALTVGDDFRFGHARRGDYAMLVDAAKKFAFSVKNTQSMKQHDCRISSTAIRQALADNDFDGVQLMLGRAYMIRGKVRHGWKKGRTLGFPTANIALKRQVAPLLGVFSVKVYNQQGEQFFGVANIGVKPTFKGSLTLLEVHIFDFEESIYGEILSVQPLTKLRDEIKFDTFSALITQIEKDVNVAKQSFGLN